MNVLLVDGKVSAIIGLGILFGLAGYFGFYLLQETTALKEENSRLVQSVSQLKSEKSSFEQQNNDLMTYVQTMNKELDASLSRERGYQSEINQLMQDAHYHQSQSAWSEYRNREIEQELSLSVSPPYTLIQERNVIWVFKDSRGNLYEWEMPIDTYRTFIEYPEPQDLLTLREDDGTNFRVRDFTKFVDSTSFAKVIDDLYENAGNDYQFVYEVWFVASHLTTYSSDIGEDPRWPLETLTEGGGDCEDLTILVASMLKASSHTNDWTIKIAYFDADNPDDPNEMNHVVLFVETDDFQTYIESTAKTNGLGAWDSINGWYFQI